jgi:nicotinamidase-related amidase
MSSSSPLGQPGTALLVIDIQRGAFDGLRCPPIADGEGLVRAARSLIDAARRAEAPVVFIQHSEEEPGDPFEDGTPHWQLHAELAPRDGDLVMKKRASSSFEATLLDDHLRGRNIGRLVLCGLQSEFCVTNTACAAMQLGYAVQVAADGHATWPSEGRQAAAIRDDVNASLAKSGAHVVPVERLVRELVPSAR